MYIDIVPNRNSPPAVLLRESKREKGKIVKTTVANLSKCPPHAVEALRLALKGVELAPKDDVFSIEASLPHGHVEAILGTIRTLGLDRLIDSRPSRQRDLVLAMIAQRLIDPCSKLATTRLWHTSSLAKELDVEDATENELYGAMDWLLARQARIEKKLAQKHLSEGARVLFDVTSSSYHGQSCPLALRGYNRDGERLPAVVYGLLADAEDRPVAVDVYPGNTADPATVPDQVEKLRTRFGLERVVLVGDRGMLTASKIENLRENPQLGWISALRSSEIRKLVQRRDFQLSLFDEQNLAEISSDLYPGERLVVCHNPLLAAKRRHTREELLEATEAKLLRIVAEVERRTKTPMTAKEIGLKAGRVLGAYKMGKHFSLDIGDGHFAFQRKQESINAEKQLDGIYIIRTNEPIQSLSAPDAVRAYKSLGEVEKAFRCLKSVDLRVRPIHHRLPDRVRAHIFLAVLTYYVEWHMRKALATLLFDDEDLDHDRWERDPVAKAQPSATAKAKKHAKTTTEGWPIHSFSSLMAVMGTRCRNTCRANEGKNALHFDQLTEPTPFQAHVFALLGLTAQKRCVQ